MKIGADIKGYKTEASAIKAMAKHSIPDDVVTFIAVQDDLFYPIIVMTPRTAAKHGLHIAPFYKVGAA